MRNVVICGVLTICLGAAAIHASVVDIAITSAADKIVSNQNGNGSWTDMGSTDFTGATAAGLVAAYDRTGNSTYMTSAQNGAGFFMNNSSLLGDEAFALTQLSTLQPNTNSNAYRTAAQNYFNTVSNGTGGTSTYVNNFVAHYTNFNPPDQSQAVIYLAYYTTAAYAVNANDRAVWRSGLLGALGQIDDNDYYPVASLGMAVWALAQTGNGLSAATTLSGPSTILNGKTLAQLSALLASEIVPSGPNAGTFFYDFGQTQSGYTEDAAMGLMGLEAAYSADATLNYGALISGCQLALSGCIGNDGSTYYDMNHDTPTLNVFGGRALGALSASVPEPFGGSMLFSIGTLYLIGRRRQSTN